MKRFIEAQSPQDYRAAAKLFAEYARSLGFGLEFQSFERELAELPGCYAPPAGRILLVRQDDRAVGCVGLRPLSADVCEMKRMYLRPECRGKGVGRDLAMQVIGLARNIGYRRMRLDTIRTGFEAALALYRSLGFVEIPPYCHNPIPGAVFMELEL